MEDDFTTKLRATYGVPNAGSPIDGRIATLATAKQHLERALETEFSCDDSEAIEAPEWWYIPYGWIGCAGFIIDKADGYINQLGSCHSLDDCFWAHNRGIKYGYADLTITQVNDREGTIDTLMKMGNRAPLNPIPNKSDGNDERRTFWTREELGQQIDDLPVTFDNQHLWFTIPALRRADENAFCNFEVTRGTWDAQFALA